MNGIKERLYRFMIGRYGTDKLGQFLIGAAFILLAAGFLTRIYWFELAAFFVLTVSYIRMFSKNIGKRLGENQRFERILFNGQEKYKKWRFKFQQFKKYHIYKCPKCGQKIRIPRGKGKLSIHCPKCKTDFIKKS
ncbi:hypothetical protein [Clostridium sp. E02]|uniref:hypothetical protein n=1 Tax=Clostridium sp. E02 TaxID=2487134 RepID=UPI000F548AB8|nr:hypothetical protein [Clostridium sp. E02]